MTIGTRLKKEDETNPMPRPGLIPLDITDLRTRRSEGETYEHIGKKYGGWTEDEVHRFIIQKGKEERENNE